MYSSLSKFTPNSNKRIKYLNDSNRSVRKSLASLENLCNSPKDIKKSKFIIKKNILNSPRNTLYA